MEKRLEIFFCYAYEDQKLLSEIKKHLTPMLRLGVIDSMWHDADISPGTEWKKEIDKHLDTAQIILLLVSSDFIASEYCYSKEMARAMERHERGEARVIPILLRSVSWQGTPFGKLQILPSNAQPITKWQDRDDACFDIAEGIEKVAKHFLRLQEAQAHKEELDRVRRAKDEEEKLRRNAAESLASSASSSGSEEKSSSSDIQHMTTRKDSELVLSKFLLRAVVVGINQYSDPRYGEKAQRLFARTDAEEIANVLHHFSSLQVEHIELLTDKQATRRTVSESMNSVFSVRSFDSNSIALFYFSGQGIIDPRSKITFLCCHDTDFVDPTQGGIRLNDISNLLLNCNAECAIAIIESSYSGSIIDTVQLHRMPEYKTIAFFTACGSDEFIRERRKLQHGIFTGALLRGWRDGEARGDGGVITLFGLADYLTSSLSNIAQTPQVFIRGNRPIVLSK